MKGEVRAIGGRVEGLTEEDQAVLRIVIEEIEGSITIAGTDTIQIAKVIKKDVKDIEEAEGVGDILHPVEAPA